jgi:hypothetical protein
MAPLDRHTFGAAPAAAGPRIAKKRAYIDTW